MLEALKGLEGPVLVVGDFNDVPTGGAYKLMIDQFSDAWADAKTNLEGFSYPADKPAKRIDYIFTRRSNQIRVRRAWIPATLASDHVPVLADLQLGKR